MLRLQWILVRWEQNVDEMDELMAVDEAANQARLSRRRALKAAAATGAGVGVLAIVGPQVGSFGAAPAYAVGCSKSDSASSALIPARWMAMPDPRRWPPVPRGNPSKRPPRNPA